MWKNPSKSEVILYVVTLVVAAGLSTWHPAVPLVMITTAIAYILVLRNRSNNDSNAATPTPNPANPRQDQQIAKLKSQLEDLQAKGAIAQRTQMLAHDMRKPFSLIKMALDQLEHEKDPVTMRSIVRRFVPAVEKALDNADRMIADVMEYGHDTDLMLENIDPYALIESTVNSVFRIKKDTNIHLDYLISSHVKISCDSLKTLRVLHNIVDNAVEAMTGRGKIWFKTDLLEIDGQYFVQFEIGNDGQKITEEKMKKLFDPFFTTGKKGGTGLGLSIAQKIIHAHGGTIRCESIEGATRFIFTLPASDAPAGLESQPLPAHSGEVHFALEAAKKSGLGAVLADDNDTLESITSQIRKKSKRLYQELRVLVVDDHHLYLTSLNAQIMQVEELEQVECSMASTSQEALEMATSERPHLIICDVDMGNDQLNGYEIVRKVREQGSEAVVCMHSNHKSPGDFETAALVGADGFLPKPMSKESLLKLLLAAIPDASGNNSRKQLNLISHNLAEVALVDDCPFTLESWQKSLADVRTHTFLSPNEFWERTESDLNFLQRLTCVVTDYYFEDEECNGDQFASRLRHQRPDLPIFLASDAKSDITSVDRQVGKSPMRWSELRMIVDETRRQK